MSWPVCTGFCHNSARGAPAVDGVDPRLGSDPAAVQGLVVVLCWAFLFGGYRFAFLHSMAGGYYAQGLKYADQISLTTPAELVFRPGGPGLDGRLAGFSAAFLHSSCWANGFRCAAKIFAGSYGLPA